MPNTNELYNQLMGLEKQAQSYEGASPGAADYISRAINEKFAYGKPILAEAAKWENQAYQQPGKLMAEYNLNTGPTSAAMINSMMGRIGSGFQRADLARSLANRQAGNLEGIANSILGQYQQYGQNLQNRYARLAPLYELGIQQQENEKNRALQRAGMARQQTDASAFYKAMDEYIRNQELRKASSVTPYYVGAPSTGGVLTGSPTSIPTRNSSPIGTSYTTNYSTGIGGSLPKNRDFKFSWET